MSEISTKGKLIITRIKGFVISMLLDERGKAVQINPHNEKDASNVGNIYMGRVDKIIPSLNAAFVEYMPGKMGYLPLKEDPEPYFSDRNRSLPLRPGDFLAVQMQRDSIKGKDPALSWEISLAGKLCVLTCCQPGLHFSSKLTDREQTGQIKKGFSSLGIDDAGFIVRTNAEGKDSDMIFSEMKNLYELWKEFRSDINGNRKISQLYKIPAAYILDVRDVYDSGIDGIITDDTEIYYELYDHLSRFWPEDLKKLAIHNPKGMSLNAVYNIKKQISLALSKKVWLKSGASVIIEHTEALTVIDVNTGKYTSKKEPENEFLKINQEAAAEIARQIRLRNISGIIIVDFINMKSAQNKKLLLDYFNNQLKFDPVKTNIIEMTKLDLVELTREKIHQPLYELLDISLLQ